MTLRLLSTLLTAGIVLAGCAARPTTYQQSELNTAASEPLTFEFATLSNSGQTGNVVIQDDESGRAVVSLTLTAQNPELYVEPQLAHIHVGACADTLTSGMEFSLMSVRDGKSVTRLPISTADLMDATTKLSIDLHKSTKESNIITNCVELK